MKNPTRQLFAPASARQVSMGLTVLRVITGIVFIAHGAQKIFVFGFDGFAGTLAQMGVPLAGIAGPAVALLEFFGGMALIAGLLTRPVAAGLAVTMLVALFLVHLPAGFFMPDGYELVLTLLGSLVTLVITGAGAWSVDARLAPTAPIATRESGTLRRAA